VVLSPFVPGAGDNSRRPRQRGAASRKMLARDLSARRSAAGGALSLYLAEPAIDAASHRHGGCASFGARRTDGWGGLGDSELSIDTSRR